MKCKQCGAYNEDYMEYCSNCAAPLVPGDVSEETAATADTPEAGRKATDVPPAWGFVRAPQWPKPDFDANTVTESDIPENYARRFEPRPAQYDEAPVAPQNEQYREAPARPFEQSAPQASAPERQYRNSVQQEPIASEPIKPISGQDSARVYTPSRKAAVAETPVIPAGDDDYQDETDEAEDYAPTKRRSSRSAARPNARKAKQQPLEEEEQGDDYYQDGEFDGGRSSKKNLLYFAAAGVLVILIVVFLVIFINTKYAGNFSKFVSCTFAGDPITREPLIEKGVNDDGDPAYTLTVYAKDNTTLRFVLGDVVREFPVTDGYIPLRIPDYMWIPDEPLDNGTIEVTPDITIITTSGKEYPVEFKEPLVIEAPVITLSMTQPTVADVTVDSTTVPVSGIVSDNTASVFVGETQVAVDEAGNFSTSFTLPGEGTYEITVEAKKNGAVTAKEVFNATYGTTAAPDDGAATPDGTAAVPQGNVTLTIDDSVTRTAQTSSMTVTGKMEAGAVVAVTGVELESSLTQDSAAGTFSFTVKTDKVGVYEAVITATKDGEASTTTLYLEHQPDKDAYMESVYRIDYERIKNYPHHEQGYLIKGTIEEVYQSTPYSKARIKTSEGDIVFMYFSGVSKVETGDGMTYSLYAEPYGTDEATGLPMMHAWFILKRAN